MKMKKLYLIGMVCLALCAFAQDKPQVSVSAQSGNGPLKPGDPIKCTITLASAQKIDSGGCTLRLFTAPKPDQPGFRQDFSLPDNGSQPSTTEQFDYTGKVPPHVAS